jgi:hypothetical protein
LIKGGATREVLDAGSALLLHQVLALLPICVALWTEGGRWGGIVVRGWAACMYAKENEGSVGGKMEDMTGGGGSCSMVVENVVIGT